MKNLTKTFIISGLIMGLYGCKQEIISPNSTVASFNVVDANIGSSSLFVNVFNKPVAFSSLNSNNYINYGSSNIYSPVAGSDNITVTQTTDTTKHLFQGNFNLQNRGIYTFFLAGTSAQPDTVLIRENLPKYANTDSVAGIRFINLSPGSGAVSVDIQGKANGSEAQTLAYKKYTSFKTYKADHTVSSYIFEFRDQSGNLLSTYEMDGVNTQDPNIQNSVLFNNMTLALIGNSNSGLQVILVPQY